MPSPSPALRSALLLFIAFLTAAPLTAREITDINGRTVKIDRGKTPARAVRQKARQPRAQLTVTVTSGPDTSAAVNDFWRIQNAINAAGDNDTIILNGTFDFTAPFAAAAWALGSDGIVSGDDYSVYIPANLNGVTLTANNVGDATIQGPGDLAAFDLESFLYFDGGDNQNWTISNLVILDFDNAIGLYFGAGGPDAFNGTIIDNNRIRVPADLNATVAPGDVLQNIGIHYAFGTNQQITNNTITLPGNSVSDAPANFASSVGMQSNTSGGAVYDGLLIDLNLIQVQNAQASNPESILGIWENGHAHSSDITVTRNTFLNNSVSNDPALNLQRAFRVTSHSSATTTVNYQDNAAGGANIGFQWLAGQLFGGNFAVNLETNTLTNCATGILVQSSGRALVTGNEITLSGAGGGIHVVTGTLDSVTASKVSNGSGDGIVLDAGVAIPGSITYNDLGGNTGFGLNNQTATVIPATLNWWGGNLAAQVAAEVSGLATVDPWWASGTDQSGFVGFDPFPFATTSGTLTTFAGTSGADAGAIIAGSPSLTMTMNSQIAFTLTAEVLNFSVQMDASNDVFSVDQTGIPTTMDGGAGNDTLIGPPAGATWTINGAGSGTLVSVGNFSNWETLRGRSGIDTFNFSPGGSVPADLDGGLGVDTLNLQPGSTVIVTGPGSLDGVMGTTSVIGATFDNINSIIGAQADLSITKSGPASAATGQNITFTIVVTNNGPSPATGVTVTDNLPAGVTFVSATPPICSGAPNLTCTVGSLLSGATFNLDITVTVTAASGTIVNTATVTADQVDGTPGNDSGTATVQIGAAAVIPTASEWGLVLLAAMLGLIAAVRLTRL